MSYVNILLTAIYSAELAEVTAMKTSNKEAAAPPLPRRATAASGSTKPAVTSASGMRDGKVGKTEFVSSARADNPIVVAVNHGIANQLSPPIM